MGQKKQAENIRKIQNINKIKKKNKKLKKQAVAELYDMMKETPYDESFDQTDKLNDIIKRIYKAEIKDIEKSFGHKIKLLIEEDCDPEVDGLYKNNTSISINTLDYYDCLTSDDVEERMLTCKEIIQTIAHEVQHHRQYLMAKSKVSSRDSILYAKDCAVQDILEERYCDDNYEELIIENDADEKATKTIIKLKKHSDEDKYEKLQYAIKKEIGNYKVDDMKVERGDKIYNLPEQRKEKILDQILDNEILVRKNLHILKSYPILKKIYNKDGTKKDTLQLIKDMKKEEKELLNNEHLTKKEKEKAIKNSEDMYLELIYKTFETIKSKQIKKVDPAILDKMKKKFFKECKKLMKKEEKSFEIKQKINEDTKKEEDKKNTENLVSQKRQTLSIYNEKMKNIEAVEQEQIRKGLR